MLDLISLRYDLQDPDLIEDDRDRLLLRAMRDVLAGQRKARLWDGDGDKALRILHAAGFTAREVQSYGADAALLVVADRMAMASVGMGR